MRRPLLLAVLLCACGGEESPSSNNTPPNPAEGAERAEQEAPAPEANQAAPSFEVHEWGLIDVGDDMFEIAAGPGEPTAAQPAPAPTPTSTMQATSQTSMMGATIPTQMSGRRKPVVYVHADAPLEFSLGVATPGPIAEHWPPAEVSGVNVRWDRVQAAPGSCTSGAYPARDDAACADAPGGYCELADLASYETSDGACLTYKDQTWDHLFYRSSGSELALPIEVRRAGTTITVTNRSLENPNGGLYYIHRGRLSASRMDVPAVGQSATFDAATTDQLPLVRAELAQTLRRGGLTEDEAQAFERAWFEELFEAGGTGGAPVVPEALLYVVPAGDLAQISSLDFSPPPREVRRVFWVRVSI